MSRAPMAMADSRASRGSPVSGVAVVVEERLEMPF
jgi:hypothetical protein